MSNPATGTNEVTAGGSGADARSSAPAVGLHAVHAVVREASRRVWLTNFLRALAVVSSVTLGLLLLTRIVERVVGLEPWFETRWMWIFVGAGVASLAGSVVWATVARPSRLAVAQDVDERAELREALSTALYLERERDPWARVVLEDSQRVAAGVRVSSVVPVQTPRLWPVPFLTLLAVIVAWFAVPSLDLLGKNAARVAQREREAEVVQVRSEVQAAREQVREALSRANPELLDEPAGEAQADEQKVDESDPEAVRRAAIRDLTDLTSRLEQAQESERAMQSEALRDAMEQLRQPGPGPMEQMSRALSRGDFQGAREAMEQLTREMSQGEMTPQQEQQAKQQMENLAQQLERLAQNTEALQKQLQDAGLDAKTAQELARAASDPAKLAEALKNTPGLSQQAQNELMKMAQAASGAQQQMQQMSSAMSQAAQGMAQEGLTQEGMAGMQEMGEALSEAEMMQSDMENLSAAMQEAQEQLSKLGSGMCENGGQAGQGGEGRAGRNGSGSQGRGGGEGEGEGQGNSEGGGRLGQWRAGTSSGQGSGSGGPGQGNGDGPQSAPTDFELEQRKPPVQTGQGPIIGSRLVFGDQVRGESRAQFAEAVAEAQQTAAEGIESMRVPRELEGAVRSYFGRLQQRAQRPEGQAAGDGKQGEAKDGQKPEGQK